MDHRDPNGSAALPGARALLLAACLLCSACEGSFGGAIPEDPLAASQTREVASATSANSVIQQISMESRITMLERRIAALEASAGRGQTSAPAPTPAPTRPAPARPTAAEPVSAPTAAPARPAPPRAAEPARTQEPRRSSSPDRMRRGSPEYNRYWLAREREQRAERDIIGTTGRDSTPAPAAPPPSAPAVRPSPANAPAPAAPAPASLAQ